MADTPRLNMPYPDFRETDWNDSFQAFADAVDANVFAVREEQNVLVRGGGNVEMNTTTDMFSWSGDILITSPTHAQTITLLAAAIAINDGEFWAVKTPKGPAGSVEVATEALNTVDPSQGYKVLGYRSGGDMVLFNGKVIPADTVVDSGLEILPPTTAGEAVEYSTIVELLDSVGALDDGTIAFVQWTPSDFIPGDTGRFTTEVRGGEVMNDPLNQLIPPAVWHGTVGTAGGWQVGAGDAAQVTVNGDNSITIAWDIGNSTNPYFTGDWGFISLTSIYLDQPIQQMNGVSAVLSGYGDDDSGPAVAGLLMNKAGAPSAGDNFFSFVEYASSSYRAVAGSEYDAANDYATVDMDGHVFDGSTGGSVRLGAALGNATYATGRVEGQFAKLDASNATNRADTTAAPGLPAQLQTDLGPLGSQEMNLHVFVGGDSGDFSNAVVTIQAIGRLTKQPWSAQRGGAGGQGGLPVEFYEYSTIPALLTAAPSLPDGSVAFVQWTPDSRIPGDTGRFSTEVRGGQVQNDPLNQLIPAERWGTDLVTDGSWKLGAGVSGDVTFNGDGTITLDWSASSTNPYWTGDRSFMDFTSIYLEQDVVHFGEVSVILADYSDDDFGVASAGLAMNRKNLGTIPSDSSIWAEVENGGGSFQTVAGMDYVSNLNSNQRVDLDANPFSGTTGSVARIEARVGNATYGTGQVTGYMARLDGAYSTGSDDSVATADGLPAELTTDLQSGGSQALELHVYAGGENGQVPNTTVTLVAIGRLSKQPWGVQMGAGGGSESSVPLVDYASFGEAYRAVTDNSEIVSVSWSAGLGVEAGNYTGRIRSNSGEFLVGAIAGKKLRPATIDTEVNTVDSLWKTNAAGGTPVTFDPDGSCNLNFSPTTAQTSREWVPTFSLGSVNSEVALWLDITVPGPKEIEIGNKLLPIAVGSHFNILGLSWRQVAAASSTVFAGGMAQGNFDGNEAFFRNTTYAGVTNNNSTGNNFATTAGVLKLTQAGFTTENSAIVRENVNVLEFSDASHRTDMLDAAEEYTPAIVAGGPSTTTFSTGFTTICFHACIDEADSYLPTSITAEVTAPFIFIDTIDELYAADATAEIGTVFRMTWEPPDDARLPGYKDSGPVNVDYQKVRDTGTTEDNYFPPLWSQFMTPKMAGSFWNQTIGNAEPPKLSYGGADVSLDGTDVSDYTYLGTTNYPGIAFCRVWEVGPQMPGIKKFDVITTTTGAKSFFNTGVLTDPNGQKVLSWFIDEYPGGYRGFAQVSAATTTLLPSVPDLDREPKWRNNSGEFVFYQESGTSTIEVRAEGLSQDTDIPGSENQVGAIGPAATTNANVVDPYYRATIDAGTAPTKAYICHTGASGASHDRQVMAFRIERTTNEKAEITPTSANTSIVVPFTDIPDLMAKAVSEDYPVGTQFRATYTPTPIAADSGILVHTKMRQSADPNVALSPKIGEQFIPAALFGSWIAATYGGSLVYNTDGYVELTLTGSEAINNTHLNAVSWAAEARARAWTIGDPIVGLREFRVFHSGVANDNTYVHALMETTPEGSKENFVSTYHVKKTGITGVRSVTQLAGGGLGAFGPQNTYTPVVPDYFSNQTTMEIYDDGTTYDVYGLGRGISSAGQPEASNENRRSELIGLTAAANLAPFLAQNINAETHPVQPTIIANGSGNAMDARLWGVQFKYQDREFTSTTSNRIPFTDIPDLITKATSGFYPVGTQFYCYYETPIQSGVLIHTQSGHSTDPNKALTPRILEQPTPVNKLGAYLNTDAGGPSTFNADGSLIMDITGSEAAETTYIKYASNRGRVWSFGDGLIGAEVLKCWVSTPTMGATTFLSMGFRVDPVDNPAQHAGFRYQNNGLMNNFQGNATVVNGSLLAHDSDSTGVAYGIMVADCRLFDDGGDTAFSGVGYWLGAASSGLPVDGDRWRRPSNQNITPSTNPSTYDIYTAPFETVNIENETHPVVPFIFMTGAGNAAQADLHMVSVQYKSTEGVALQSNNYGTLGDAIRNAPVGSKVRVSWDGGFYFGEKVGPRELSPNPLSMEIPLAAWDNYAGSDSMWQLIGLNDGFVTVNVDGSFDFDIDVATYGDAGSPFGSNFVGLYLDYVATSQPQTLRVNFGNDPGGPASGERRWGCGYWAKDNAGGFTYYRSMAAYATATGSLRAQLWYNGVYNGIASQTTSIADEHFVECKVDLSGTSNRMVLRSQFLDDAGTAQAMNDTLDSADARTDWVEGLEPWYPVIDGNNLTGATSFTINVKSIGGVSGCAGIPTFDSIEKALSVVPIGNEFQVAYETSGEDTDTSTLSLGRSGIYRARRTGTKSVYPPPPKMKPIHWGTIGNMIKVIGQNTNGLSFDGDGFLVIEYQDVNCNNDGTGRQIDSRLGNTSHEYGVYFDLEFDTPVDMRIVAVTSWSPNGSGVNQHFWGMYRQQYECWGCASNQFAALEFYSFVSSGGAPTFGSGIGATAANYTDNPAEYRATVTRRSPDVVACTGEGVAFAATDLSITESDYDSVGLTSAPMYAVVASTDLKPFLIIQSTLQAATVMNGETAIIQYVGDIVESTRAVSVS